MKGYFALVLHTHMPYVRKNGVWPVGEDWLHQVMSNTYLPLLGMLSQLEHEGLESCLALTLTPVLCEQLGDGYIQERFLEYLNTMFDKTSRDLQDFEYFQDPERKDLAEAYREEYLKKRIAFEAIGGDILGALASFEASGQIETIASSATHALLPLHDRWSTVRNQVLLGIESHRKRLGRNPSGFWLPECAYRDGIEELLESEGIDYILPDPTSLGGLPSTCPYRVGRSNVAALAFSQTVRDHVWDYDHGYPTDGTYIDSTKYYLNSGLHYWRVTGPDVSIEEKRVYDPDRAMKRAFDHSVHYLGEIEEELENSPACSGDSRPIVLASYDTELFGHAWKEGFDWMEITLRSLAASAVITLATPRAYLESNRPGQAVDLRETSWDIDKDYASWVVPETEPMWIELDKVQAKYLELAAIGHSGSDTLENRALAQAARELMLLEASDWPYMVARDRSKKYATQRFDCHLERFREIAEALERGGLARIESRIAELEEIDNIFKDLDASGLSGDESPAGKGG